MQTLHDSAYDRGMSDRTPTERALDARRKALRLTWRSLYTRAGISHDTLRKARLEEPVSPKTLDDLEDAVGWERGSLDRIRATQDDAAARVLGDPTPTGRPGATDGSEWLDETPLAGGGTTWTLTRIIDGRPASMSIADFDDTPAEEIRAELREVMNEAEVRQHRRLARNRESR